MRRILILIAAVASGFAVFAVAASTHRVTIGADGSFSPAVLHIRAGDTVEWKFSSRTQSVVAAESSSSAPLSTTMCPTPRSFAPNDAASFAGPMPFAPSGIYSLGPLEDRGLSIERGACRAGRSNFAANGLSVCGSGAPLTTMEETWADPNTTGVFVRLLWNQLQTAPGTGDSSFNFTDLDREITQAVRHGKVYSLSIKAGQDGTPEWLFSTDANGRPRPGNGGGVKRLVLQDSGSGPELRNNRECGARMTLGSPTDPAYQKHYFDMLRKVAEHIRVRADWYRALAYFKPSGANLISHENRLPKRCDTGCICNTQVFAESGYTPTKLYDFYSQQFTLVKKEFPGKAISYQLIQDGFPLVNDSGGWEKADGGSSNGRPLPAGVEQTEKILALGEQILGSLFVVQHNGLQVYRGECVEQGQGRRGRGAAAANRGVGCPNPWVLTAGADGKTITGFQTQNPGDISSAADVDLAMKNALANSDATFVELYEAPLWLAVHADNGVLPSRKTLGQWGKDLDERRRKKLSSMGDPFPTTFRHTFSGIAPGTVYYFDPSSCRTTVSVGTIVVDR